VAHKVERGGEKVVGQGTGAVHGSGVLFAEEGEEAGLWLSVEAAKEPAERGMRGKPGVWALAATPAALCRGGWG